MKFRIVFIGVFLITFLTGYVFVPQQKQAEKTLEVSAVISPRPPDITVVKAPGPALETIEETIEETDNWVDEENYSFKIRMLETGEFHWEEVKAKTGELWLGLYCDENGAFLKYTHVEIKRIPDPIYSENKDEKGKSVIVRGKNQPLFLLANAKTLKAGKVETLFQGLTWRDVLTDEDAELTPDELLTTLNKDFVQEYEIGGKKFVLRVIEAKNKKDEKILALILEDGGKRQVLHTMRDQFTASLGILYWAGDLDRDSRPDFYLELYEHDNVDNKVLYLSSEAEPGKLVKKSAYFWTTGC